MKSRTRSEFLSNREWFRAAIGNQDLVLRHTSALECLGLFVGYFHKDSIDVYAHAKGQHENINYAVVDSFDDLDIVRIGGLMCTSPAQTFNDMLALYGTAEESNLDEQSLIEALSEYYFAHGRNFGGLHIGPEHLERFNVLKEWAVEHFDVT